MQALQECAERVHGDLGAAPSLAFLFVSATHRDAYPALAKAVGAALKPAQWLGCSAGGVIGAGAELEGKPALCVVAARLPGVRTILYPLEQGRMPSPDAPPKAWRALSIIQPDPAPAGFVILSDPFSLNAEDLLAGLDFAYPGVPKIGGLASGGRRPGECALFIDGKLHRSGAAILTLSGNVALEPIVAQGCRPIGTELRVTRCDRNVLIELDGKPALRALAELLDGLSPADKILARSSLFLGLRASALAGPGAPERYLIRNLVGVDHERGLLAVGAQVRPGQALRFHLRDRAASTQDLRDRLAEYQAAPRPVGPAGALLFSCLGRGEHLYGRAGHDSQAFAKTVSGVPLGGFFCNGEIGPVEKTTYLHGYTSCFGVFRPSRSL